MARSLTKDVEDAVKLERAERLVQARRELAGFSSAQKACDKFHWPLEAYKAHESGRNGFSSATGMVYADAFGVSRQWLYLGVGMPYDIEPVEKVTTVPVYSNVPAGRMQPTAAVVRPDDVKSHIVISGLGKGDWAALIVMGDSMDKIAPDGSTIVFNRADTRPVDNGFFVFEHPDTGDATFKRFGAGNPPRLRPYSYGDHDSIPVSSDIVIVGRVKKVIVDV